MLCRYRVTLYLQMTHLSMLGIEKERFGGLPSIEIGPSFEPIELVGLNCIAFDYIVNGALEEDIGSWIQGL